MRRAKEANEIAANAHELVLIIFGDENSIIFHWHRRAMDISFTLGALLMAHFVVQITAASAPNSRNKIVVCFHFGSRHKSIHPNPPTNPSSRPTPRLQIVPNKWMSSQQTIEIRWKLSTTPLSHFQALRRVHQHLEVEIERAENAIILRCQDIVLIERFSENK